MGSEELEDVIHRLRGPRPKGIDLSPTTPFEAVLDERIKAMERSVGELKGRINGLLIVVVGAIIAQIVLGVIQ